MHVLWFVIGSVVLAIAGFVLRYEIPYRLAQMRFALARREARKLALRFDARGLIQRRLGSTQVLPERHRRQHRQLGRSARRIARDLRALANEPRL